jgi:hypothetical protein
VVGFNRVLTSLRILTTGAVAAAVLLYGSASAQAAGADSSGGIEGSAAEDPPDIPIPSTAHDAYSPLGDGFGSPIEPREDLRATKPKPKPQPEAETLAKEEAEEEVWLGAMRRRLDDATPFVRDTEVKVNSRSYWLSRDNIDGSHAEALTSGGYVSYQSGYAGNFLQLRGVLYTTQPIYAPPGGGGTFNLTPDQDQITTLGQANARFRIAGQELSVGQQLVRTAFINPKDTRMIPLTFEGVVLVPERREDQGIDYIASYLSKFKPRDDADFVPFTEPLGVREDSGVLITGVRHTTNSFTVGAVNYWIKDTWNTTYGEADYLPPFGGGEGPSYRISLNDLDQRSVGADLIPGGPFATYQASARLVASYAGFVLTTAGSTTGEDANIRDPFGNIPVYTSMHQSSFERAGEEAYLVTLSYDFAKLGFEGLKFMAGFGQGADAINPATEAHLPNRNLMELYLDYEPESGLLEGFRMQLYYSDERLFGADLPRNDQSQFRAVVNYLMPLL